MAKTFSISAQSLGDKLKAHARNLKLDVNHAASRHVAERLLYQIADYRNGRVIVAGGMLFPQTVRETVDLDIIIPDHSSDREIMLSTIGACKALSVEGIDAKVVSEEPEYIDVGYGDPVRRIRIAASAGGIRANTHIDIKTVTKRAGMPLERAELVVKSIIPGVPDFTVLAQSWDAVIAEKFLACITRHEGDRRTKHFDDISLLARKGKLNPRKVAEELERIVKYRGLSMGLCTPAPTNLMTHPDPVPFAAWMTVHRELQASFLRDLMNDSYTYHFDIDALLSTPTVTYDYTPGYKQEDAA